MSEHLTKNDLDGYANGPMNAERLLTLDAHLKGCDKCRSILMQKVDTTSMAASLARLLTAYEYDDQHLTYQQLSAYVDGEMGPVEREIADVHAEVCEICSVQLFDLRRLRDELTMPVSAVATEQDEPGLFERLRAAMAIRWAVPLAAAAVLLGLGTWALLNADRSVPEQEVAVIEPTSAPVTPAIVDMTPETVQNVDTNATEAPSKKPELTLADGSVRIIVDEAGNVTGINAGQFEATVKAALTRGELQVSADAAKLRPGSGVLMGPGETGVPFKLVSPVGRVVAAERPVFRWSAVAGAESYVVNIYDENFNKVASSPTVQNTSWLSSRALKRGVIYNWQVTALKDGQEIRSPVRPAPDARFKVLDARHANEVAAAKRKAGGSHLILGLVYAKAGLLDEAEREFQALLKQNPGSEIARRLLNKVRSAK